MAIDSNVALVKRTGILSVGKILQSTMSFFATIYMAHVLGPVDFGIIGFTAAITAYFGLASTLGIPTMATREISKADGDFARQGLIVGDVAYLTAGLALTSYALLWLFTPIFTLTPTVQAILLISGLQVLINSLSPQWASVGIQRTDFNVIANIIGTLIRVSLVFLLIHGPKNLLDVPAVAAVGTLATVIVEWWLFHKVTPIRWSPSWSRLWSIFRRSLPLTTASAMMQIYSSVDTIFLGYWDGLGVVGYYNAAYKLVLFLTNFTTVYNQIIFPLATRLYFTDTDRLKSQLSNSLSVSTLVTMPIMLGGSWLAGPIIRTIFGSQFGAAAPVLRILLWSWGATVATLHYGSVLVAGNQERRFAKGIAWGAMINLVANLIAIPLWGDIGAAASILVTELANLAYMMYHMYRQLGWYGPSSRTLLGVTASSGFMLAGLDLLSRRLNFFESIVLGALLYSLGLLITRTVRPHQIRRAARVLVPQSRLNKTPKSTH